MKKLALTILMAMIACMCLAQGMSEQEVKAAINSIKLDSAYLYGDATMPSQEESEQQARLFLMDSMKELWPDMEVDQTSISYLTHMRLDMFRTLAYVRKDAVGKIQAERGWSAEDSRLLMDALSKTESMENLIDICHERFSITEVTIDTDDKTFRDSYIAVFRGKRLSAAYTPADSEGTRQEIRSGRSSRRIEYTTKDKVYYISLKK